MEQAVRSSSSGLSGCAMGCAELQEAQPARRASPEESPAALESLELAGGAVQIVTLLFKHLDQIPLCLVQTQSPTGATPAL